MPGSGQGATLVEAAAGWKASGVPAGSPATSPARTGKLHVALASPAVGLSPWIVMALIEGPAPFEAGAAAALGVALGVVGLDRLRGSRPKLIELADVTFFAALTLLALLGGDDVRYELERWAGEISSGTLTLIALTSIARRNPFTLQYTREEVEPELWENRTFLHTNYVLTSVWSGAFTLTAIAGAVGVIVLDQPNNFWTGWTVQAGAMIFAIQFGRWYPRVTRVRARRAAGVATEAEPPVSALLLPLCPYVTALGILALAFDPAPDPVGYGLIAAGIALARVLARRSRAP